MVFVPIMEILQKFGIDLEWEWTGFGFVWKTGLTDASRFYDKRFTS
jgi:hypothetical protein